MTKAGKMIIYKIVPPKYLPNKKKHKEANYTKIDYTYYICWLIYNTVTNSLLLGSYIEGKNETSLETLSSIDNFYVINTLKN